MKAIICIVAVSVACSSKQPTNDAATVVVKLADGSRVEVDAGPATYGLFQQCVAAGGCLPVQTYSGKPTEAARVEFQDAFRLCEWRHAALPTLGELQALLEVHGSLTVEPRILWTKGRVALATQRGGTVREVDAELATFGCIRPVVQANP